MCYNVERDTREALDVRLMSLPVFILTAAELFHDVEIFDLVDNIHCLLQQISHVFVSFSSCCNIVSLSHYFRQEIFPELPIK